MPIFRRLTCFASVFCAVQVRGAHYITDFDGHFSKAKIFNPHNENQIDFYDQTIPVYAQAMLSLPAQQN